MENPSRPTTHVVDLGKGMVIAGGYRLAGLHIIFLHFTPRGLRFEALSL